MYHPHPKLAASHPPFPPFFYSYTKTHSLQGDLTIPAYTPVEEEWFCDGYAAMLG